MALSNGLSVRDDLDGRMREYVNNIKLLSGEISGKNSEIQSTQTTLDELRSEGLVTSELEESFSRAIQKTLDEKTELEGKRETIKETATKELKVAKEKYDKAVDNLGTSGGSQATVVLSSIRERVIEIGKWEKELRDAIDDDDNHPPATKRLVLRR